MRQIYHILRKFIWILYLSPLWLLIRLHPKRNLLLAEEKHWLEVLFPEKKDTLDARISLCLQREYRTAVYYRVREARRLVSWFIPGQYACVINCPEVGENFIIHHGHSTRIGARQVGKNFEVWQNVTIGHQHPTDLLPLIGDNVKVGCGAIVVGGITIGDGAVIGAGAVVVKDVPPHAVVVGNPSRIIRYIVEEAEG